MKIKIHKDSRKKETVSAIPEAKVKVSWGSDEKHGPHVIAWQEALDCYSFGAVVASLRMSPDEARKMAAELIRNADIADGHED